MHFLYHWDLIVGWFICNFYGYVPYTRCVWCTCLFYFMIDILDVAEGGSCSHLVMPAPSVHFLSYIVVITAKLFELVSCWCLILMLWDYQMMCFKFSFYMMRLVGFYISCMHDDHCFIISYWWCLARWIIIICILLWLLTPYLHVYGVRVCFCMTCLIWLRKGVVVTC